MESIDSAAAAWLARRDAGFGADDEQEFEGWLRADPRHASAWAALISAWTAFDEPRRLGATGGMIRELAVRRRRRRRRWTAGAAAAVAMAAAALVILPRPAAPASPASARAGVAVLSRPERQVLADGSVIELNLGAAIKVDYRVQSREVQLVQGEAHFAVAKNPARPFIVTAGTVAVRAVGTAFAVRLGPQGVDVLVTEGRVAVDRTEPAGRSGSRPPPRATIFVSAGGHVLVPTAGIPVGPLRPELLPRAEIERRLAWRGPRLELSGTPLAQAVEMFNRENSVRLVVTDPALGRMRMSGLFRADNAEGFVRLLEANFGVKADRRETGVIGLSRRP